MHIAGRVCMDQAVLDLQGNAQEMGVSEGDTVKLLALVEVLFSVNQQQTIGRAVQTLLVMRFSPAYATVFHVYTLERMTC